MSAVPWPPTDPDACTLVHVYTPLYCVGALSHSESPSVSAATGVFGLSACVELAKFRDQTLGLARVTDSVCACA